VTGRELVFSNPDVVRLAKTAFVPYAGDQWYLHRQKDADGAYFWKVAQQGHFRERPESTTRQGIYVATVDGQLLGSDPYIPSVKRMVDLLERSLERGKQHVAAATVEAAPAADHRYTRVPPEGGLILDVFTRIPRSAGSDEKWTPNHATGRDHMWLTREEWRALLPARWEKGARAAVPRAVAERLIRFHLVDNVRGEPPMWRAEEVRQGELALVVDDPSSGRLRLEGAARMAAEGRGYDARVQGYVEYDRTRDRITRFDVLSWGEAWGEGSYTRGAPKGRFPLRVALSLAGNSPADRVPPQASRDLGAYFGTGR